MHDRAMKALMRLQEARLNEEARSQEEEARLEEEDQFEEDTVEGVVVKPEPVIKTAVPRTSEPPQHEKQNLQNEANEAVPCPTEPAIKPPCVPEDLPLMPKN
jgi:hypothetical protein